MMRFFSCLILIAGSIGIQSCSKEVQYSYYHPDEIIPRSEVPQELINGSWFTGTLSAISYFDRDGHQLGHDYEAGREYRFFNDSNGKGRIQFWQYLGTRNFSNCETEIFTFKEGTVGFEGNRFSFYPERGNFKTIKNNCSVDSKSSRYADKSELQPITFRWEIKDLNGIPHLYIYSDDDTEMENVLFVFENVE